MAGGRDPTLPEYVVSDMLRPLPELDWSFDSSPVAIGSVRPAVLPVNDCQSEAPSRLACTSVIHGEEGNAASHVISDDDSFSSGNENSPGGFPMRHNLSPFHLRFDRKSLQIPKGRGRGVRHVQLSDTTVGRPVYVGAGRGVLHGASDAVVGRGCDVRCGWSPDSVVGLPVFCGRGRGRGGHGRSVGRGPSSDTSLDRSVSPPELQCAVNAAAWGDELCVEAGPRPAVQQTSSCWCGNSRHQRDAGLHVSSAACQDCFPLAERQCMPTYFAPCEPSSTHGQLMSDIAQPTFSAAASSGAAGIGGDSPLERQGQSKVVRRGRRLLRLFDDTDVELLFERSDDNTIDSDVDAHVDTEVELIKFEPSSRYIVLSVAISICTC